MRSTLLILTLISFFSTTLWGQYPVIPKTGEGRHDRSSETVFWPNRIFTHPSIFFMDGRTDKRPIRKWWRTPIQAVSPLPVSLLGEEPLDPALFRKMGEPLLFPSSRGEGPVAERSSAKGADSFAKQADDMAFERDPFLPTMNCRLTHQILDHLRPSSEMNFLPPAGKVTGRFVR